MSALTKLMTARIKLQNTQLSKSGHNKFAGYRYFELGDFLPAIQSIFADIGLCGIVSYGLETATLTITDTEDSTSVVITSPMSTAALKGCHEVQNLGAVQTYIRRYLWVTALEIVEHDALDSSPPVEDTETLDRALDAIAAADSIDTLKTHYAAAYSLYSRDKAALKLINAAKDARKSELTEAESV